MRAALGVLLVGAFALGGCGGAERRPDPSAGTFRMTSAAHGDTRLLALVANDAEVPLARLLDAPPGAADGITPEGVDADVAAVADWRLASFGQGLYRLGSAGAGDRLSLSAGYGTSPAGVELALSKKSAFQLWYVVPLEDGRCRLVSALFPEASLDVGEDGRTPRLATSADDAPGQRWRLAPLAGTTADGLPSLCTGIPRED